MMSAGMMGGALSAGAQTVTPSALTPHSFRSVPKFRPAPDAAATGTPASAHVTSDLSVTPGSIDLEGAFGEIAAQARALAQPFEGRRVGVHDLYDLAAEIEALYARAGYVLVRVTLPPQELVDNGPVRMLVIDGVIEAIDTSAVPAPIRALVETQTAGLIGRHRVTLTEIERHLLLAGRGPGLRLTSTLAKGESVGGARLILEGEHDLANAAIGTDNRISDDLGRWRTTASVTLNSPLGLGEEVYAAAIGPAEVVTLRSDAWPQTIGAFGIVLPIGADGLTFNPEYSRSKTTTPVRGSVPATEGVFDRLALRLAYPLVLTRTQALDVSIAAEHIRQISSAPDFATDLSQDAYWVVRASGKGHRYLGGDLLVGAEFTVSHGLSGRDRGEATATDVPLSRDGAGPVFTKLTGEVRASKPLGARLRSDTTISAQHALGDPLLRPEQFVLDGASALSAFDLGTFSVDSGATMRSELVMPISFVISIREVALEPYVFGAAGLGLLEEPTVLEERTIEAYAFGAGVRASLAPLLGGSAAQGLLELSKGYTTANTDPPPDWRLVSSLSVSF